ncbi:MAG: PTS system mannose/fructose/sorbose family transporter subunit IID [Deltaproteobacteria bacterium]|nr:PTS system mannose/fructose/sorbose family transporter subunit IID [Deltaproteobacteria bacterium]
MARAMISAVSFIKVFIGSFFIQSSWSFEKMQGLGFASAISPALDEIYGGDEAQKKGAYKRHLAFYNAHPYMASPVLGVAINMEEKARRGECAKEAPARFKSLVMGPYGAIGDAFFWGAARPLASIAGVLATVFWSMWGPLVFLVVYNLFHLLMRWYGLKKGIELGDGVVAFIKSLDLPMLGVRLKYLSAALLGVLCAASAVSLLPPSRGGAMTTALAIAASVTAALLSGYAFKKGLTIQALASIVLAPLILYGIIF